MTKKDKLLQRLISKPTDFKWWELKTLMNGFGFEELKTGKTSGSRAGFVNDQGVMIKMHKPHGSKPLLRYQVVDVLDFLKREKLI